jgi:hypothetical protein
VWVYFIPGWIAADKKKEGWQSIVFLNILAGWTIVGWIAALAMALTNWSPMRKRGL